LPADVAQRTGQESVAGNKTRGLVEVSDVVALEIKRRFIAVHVDLRLE